MLATVCMAVIAIYFWPLTLIVLYFMYWQVTVPVTIVGFLLYCVLNLIGAIGEKLK